ncbi:hypothetical protein LZ32DRAFT_161487 [Colletotrichum eremochloae]|nr:hypothetical protein LZ32DRAFT_161487 [Colletotrichum eremochloae]
MHSSLTRREWKNQSAPLLPPSPSWFPRRPLRHAASPIGSSTHATPIVDRCSCEAAPKGGGKDRNQSESGSAMHDIKRLFCEALFTQISSVPTLQSHDDKGGPDDVTAPQLQNGYTRIAGLVQSAYQIREKSALHLSGERPGIAGRAGRAWASV